MRLLATSDLHLGSRSNWEAMAALPAYPEDWLILGGDIAERFETTRDAFELLSSRFAKLIWVPGNHDLWKMPGENFDGGEAKYFALVELGRRYGVITPEDPYPLWTGPGGPCLITPLFLHYDYSFRPDDIPLDQVISWAEEENTVCADEVLLDPAPYSGFAEWCHERCRLTEKRLQDVGVELPKVIINHYPLRRDLVYIPRIPRFTPWCGTRLSEDWHRRFNAKVVVSGHLHVRRTDWRDGTRFEEVSLGNPTQWKQELGMAAYLRQILPEPALDG